jgi:uncharacterized protein (DUF697 family)
MRQTLGLGPVRTHIECGEARAGQVNANDIKGWIGRTQRYLGSSGKVVSDGAARIWPQVWQAVMAPKSDAALDAAIAEKAAASAPVVWLIGKVQSGKSSIVRTLTGATAAEVGSGFKACTKTAMVFDFPTEAPVIRFLDTRGLGEAAYDASEDIAFGEGQAHLILAVMRVLDPEQGAVLAAITAARRRHPGWPVVVAQTCLHEAYKPGGGHVLPYPFAGDLAGLSARDIPADLVRSLKHQRTLFEDLPGDGPVSFVAIDFTLAGDGLPPADYGRAALVSALEAAAPAGLPADAREQQSEPHIMGYAAAAAAADIVPLAGAVAVPAIQAKMLHSLALIHAVQWDRQVLAEFSACLGAGTATRIAASLGLRQLAKLIPVYGQTVGAAAAAATSFATTVALGKAAVYFLKRRRVGVSDPDGVASAYREALAEAFRAKAGTP